MLKSSIDKLETTPADLSKLSDVLGNNVVKKILCNELAKKVNAIQTNDTTNLVKKADYTTKIQDIENKIPDHDKYITAQEFSKLTADNFTARLKQAKLATKDDIADFVKKVDFNEKQNNKKK